jgi:tetratricopeptide (TPR) repeat protein
VAKRYSRKELRRPDEFVTFWSRVGRWFAERARALALGAAALAVVVGGIWGYSTFAEGRTERASQRLSTIVRTYHAPLKTEAPAGAAAGETPVPPQVPDDEDVPRFKTEQERREALLKELETFQRDYGGSRVAREAELTRAGVFYDLGRYDEAAQVYTRLLAQSGADERVRLLAREGRGLALEAKGNFDAALQDFRKLQTEAPFYQDRALYGEARLLERKGDRAGAVKLYRQILEKSPATPLRDEINNRLAALES